MFRIFQPVSTLDRLKEKYSLLMKRSFETALYDKKRSDILHDKASKILDEIRAMEESKEYS